MDFRVSHALSRAFILEAAAVTLALMWWLRVSTLRAIYRTMSVSIMTAWNLHLLHSVNGLTYCVDTV